MYHSDISIYQFYFYLLVSEPNFSETTKYIKIFGQYYLIVRDYISIKFSLLLIYKGIMYEKSNSLVNIIRIIHIYHLIWNIKRFKVVVFTFLIYQKSKILSIIDQQLPFLFIID
jgi:hypothetical protein